MQGGRGYEFSGCYSNNSNACSDLPKSPKQALEHTEVVIPTTSILYNRLETSKLGGIYEY